MKKFSFKAGKNDLPDQIHTALENSNPENSNETDSDNTSAFPVNVHVGKAGVQAMRGGSFSLILICFVLAIVIVVNIMASYLPASMTNFDISSSRLYSITSNTKVVVNSLDKDVTIYWIVQADEEDDVLSNLLDKYGSLSDHIQVVKKNPDTYPTFTEQYTDEDVANNSLIVECGDKSRYIAYDDIYESDNSYYQSYSYGASATSFDGEGEITSAIKYVVSDNQPIVYELTGHGEDDMGSEFSDEITKSNIDLEELSLVSENEVPEDASCVLIYAPSTDISEEEESILASYLEDGGKILVTAGMTEDGTLPNLYTLLSDYGVTASDGVVLDTDSDYYGFGVPYALLPTIESDDVTTSLLDDGYYVLMPVAEGLTIGDDNGSATVTPLLTTSESSYSKAAGYSMTTYDKEDGDTDGPFEVGVKVDTDAGGSMIWYSSSLFLTDSYNSASSGANVTLAINSLTSLIGDTDAISIPSKSLSNNYLTISDTAAGTLKIVMIGICPGIFAAAGIVVVLRRRRLKNNA